MLILLFMGITLFQPQEPVTQTDLKILEDKIQNKIDSQKNDVNAMWNGLDKRVANNEFNWIAIFGGGIISIATIFGLALTLGKVFEKRLEDKGNALLEDLTNKSTLLKEGARQELENLINHNQELVRQLLRGAHLERAIFEEERLAIITNGSDGCAYSTLNKTGFKRARLLDYQEIVTTPIICKDYDTIVLDQLEEGEIKNLMKILDKPIFHALLRHRIDLNNDERDRINISNSTATLLGNLMDTIKYRRRLAEHKTEA